MIYLESPRILFIKPRKVAGTSFEIALSKFAKGGDIVTEISPDDEVVREQLGFQGAKNFSYSVKDFLSLDKKKLLKSFYERKMPRKFYNHISASELKVKLGDAVWDNSTKITIVRNPYERIVSQYYYSIKEEGGR